MKLFKKIKKLQTAKEIFRNGFAEVAKDFKRPDTSPADFKKGGYPAWAVRQMGYTASQMRNGGYSIRALKLAGFTEDEINAIKD